MGGVVTRSGRWGECEWSSNLEAMLWLCCSWPARDHQSRTNCFAGEMMQGKPEFCVSAIEAEAGELLA